MLDRFRRGPFARRAARLATPALSVPAAVHALVVWRGRPPLDRDWYAAQGFDGSRGQVAHYLLGGRRAGWSLHPLLEPAWLAPGRWRRWWPEPAAVRPPNRPTHPALALNPTVPQDVLRAAVVAAARARGRAERLRLLPRVQDAWVPPPSAQPPPPLALPSVTVVMPVLDRPAQVAEAIASVQAQTHRDWQLVVVDDGSSDSTPDVVADLARDDPRIELVLADHGGVSASRNLGAAHATGEVLAWLDSDNTWSPDHLRRMLTTLATSGAESAYAVLEQHDGDGVRFRALDAGRDALELQNHIDLNVLVARRAAIEAVGGFDPTLRRAVDYDLVLRLAARSVPVFVPAVGARYDARRDATDRVTVREAATWSDVVRARRLVDWAALRADPRPVRPTGRLSVVLVVGKRTDPAVAPATVLEALLGAVGDVEVVVVDAGGSRATGTMLAGLAAASDRVQVVRWPGSMTPGWALAHALALVTGTLVAVPEVGTPLRPGYDVRWRAGVQDQRAALVDGTVVARFTDLVTALADSGCAVALDPTPGWRRELVGLLASGTGGAKSDG